ncbi:mediator of RNA polymerase II transcription subunit 12-like [Tasmannia lanceolata]|uniref:mediator of RNA polymerase II transcription subunit 12-like n=1 Tax=Tasmannia lanceolata TaxID=3420 RepID=UPI004064336A
MQRYPATSCGGGVSNSAVGGTPARDTARADSSFPSSNFSFNSRRSLQLTAYKLKCDKEHLNSRLGPPDFYPQTSNCPEETLTREYLQSGYKETIEGIEESREIALTQVGPSSLLKPAIVKCKELIRKRLRAINESRAQKRKAGQVYGVPLAGPLLIKPGVFPEQRPCGEDSRKKWIEGLSQQHKQLRSLADNVPHGYRKKSLFEVLIKHNVPLLRATWFIKVTYLNQVRPTSTSVSPGTPDKSHLARSELWTKDLIEYLQYLLDEFFSKDGSFSTPHGRDQSSQTLVAGSVQQKGDTLPVIPDGDEPALQFKWWYMVHILQWHHAEGLLISSHIIEWVLNQLQEKESLEVLQLLLPIVLDMIEGIALSQTYVRMLVDVAVRSILDISACCADLVDGSGKAYIVSALVEMLRFLILSVPDTFVGLDCFPLPSCVVPKAMNDGNFWLKDAEKVQYSRQYVSFGHIMSSVQKRAAKLAAAVNPSLQGHGVAKLVQALDRALILGDVQAPYNCLFDNSCEGGIEEGWISYVSPCLRSSLKWIGTVSLSVVISVFYLCEWATCDFRDCRASLPHDIKYTGRKDFSQVYIAVLLLKLKMEDIRGSVHDKKVNPSAASAPLKGPTLHDSLDGSKSSADILQSPGPLHDIVVCWLDQHEISRVEGFKRLQMLIMELIRFGIFYPQAYVRQLIISGIMDKNEALADLDRKKRHYRILKQLPAPYLLNALEDAKIAQGPLLLEAMLVYSNERRLVLHGLRNEYFDNSAKENDNSLNFSLPKQKDNTIAELKAAISVLLHLPSNFSTHIDTRPGESQGILKRPIGSLGMTIDVAGGTTPGCEECKRAKRQKTGEERSTHLTGFSTNPSDDEDTWWVKKGPKSLETFKIDPPLKLTKHASRGRRKTQSLAQLAAARIESSQGASTSHVCDNKISCPHHRPVMEGEMLKSMDGTRTSHLTDIVTIGKALKKLRLLEKRSITLWLIASVKQLVEGCEKAVAKVGQCTEPFSPAIDERNSVRWKLGEEDLSFILYLLDVSSDSFSAVKLLLWLLPKALTSPNPAIHGGRNVLVLARNSESHACDIGEAFLLSCIRRYENVLVAADLLPETLSAAMHRAVAVMTSNGRASGSAAFAYARNLLKKYGSVSSVEKWEKNFKATCDQRLLVELETGRSLDSELGFSPVGIPVGVDDVDDYFRQKICGRSSRASPTMKEIVQRNVEEALQYFYGKERKLFGGTTTKSSPSIEKWDDGYQRAQQIVLGLVDCIRQNGGATQEGDPVVIASAVSAIVGNVGPAIAKMPDFTGGNYPGFSSTISPLNFARRIIHIHITCLCLLKEALGDRHSRVFEIAFAAEAASTVSGAFAPGKARSQFQLSPETLDSSTNLSNENLNNSAKVFHGRAAKAVAAVSALVIGAVVYGVISLERMVTVFRLKEGLDIFQFIKSARSSSNSISRSVGSFKVDNSIEVSVHWFRLLVGNCRTVSEGLVVELLGESHILALLRMQRLLPINLVFPPAYSIFAMVLWRPYILNTNVATREDIQLYQSLSLAIGDALRHHPFRDVCLRDTQAFYDLLASDPSDSEFAAMLELHASEKYLKTMAFVPLRARLFLNAILDCKLPQFTHAQDDGTRVPGHDESKIYAGNEMKLLDQLVHVLDTLQPAKFHWQWVELRLLLNEQVLIQIIEAHNMSLADAIRSLSPNADNSARSDNEKNFTEIVMTRLLVRPDAAPLFSEVVHLLGRSLEEALLQNAKWFLQGNDVLSGRKSIRQRLINVAQSRGLSTKVQFWKPWGWSSSTAEPAANRGDKRKLDAMSLEEGEVVEEGVDIKRSGKSTSQMFDMEGLNSSQQHATEKALAELVLPCIDRSSSDARNTFASELIKYLGTIEQQINALNHGASKQAGAASSGVEGATNKGNTRKGVRGGSPGLGRRHTGPAESVPPSAALLRASMWLRLQFLLRLFPIIYADREPSSRNMRHMLASILLRLLGTRLVHEDADLSFFPLPRNSPSKEAESLMEVSAAESLNFCGDSLFDRFLSFLHGLLSSCKPSWLKPKSSSKSTGKSSRDFCVFDREAAENLQTELDRMELPPAIRRRLQAAMPILPPSLPFSVSCQPPTVPATALTSLQATIPAPGFQQGNSNLSQRSSVSSARSASTIPGKSKSFVLHDADMEIDPWMLLEDGTGSGPASGNNSVGVGGDHSNLKASNFLKGAVRVRKTDLTYIGNVDDDS